MKGNPDKAKMGMAMRAVLEGADFEMAMSRISWLALVRWIKEPAAIKREDLNRAWVIRWKNATIGAPIARVTNMKDSCLRVDKAITFLKSRQNTALPLESRRVNLLITVSVHIIVGWKQGEVRIIRYTPAVTKVEEWTRDETGVGAAMASGNHVQYGNMALLVMAAERTAKDNRKDMEKDIVVFKKTHEETSDSVMIPVKIIKMSPIRFLITVVRPLPEGFIDW